MPTWDTTANSTTQKMAVSQSHRDPMTLRRDVFACKSKRDE